MEFAAILAAPRSGSTLLQNLLGAHPGIVTPQETHLFHNYLAPLLTEWDRQSRRVTAVSGQLVAGDAPERRLVGLPTLFEDDEFLGWLRTAVTMLVDRAAAAKPAADLVVEKTPSNSLAAAHILRVRPDTRFVHLVRDPRNVVASQLGAQAWAGPWADLTVHEAAEQWAAHVRAAAAVDEAGAQVRLVRYEDLVASPSDVLGDTLDFLGRPLDAGQRATIVERVQAGHVEYALRPSLAQRITPEMLREPAGFARAPGERRRTLSAAERHIVAELVGELAAGLGYSVTSDATWPTRALARVETLRTIPARARRRLAG